MLPYFSEKFGNAASVNHVFGTEAAEAVEKARAQVAGFLHANPREIIFTSGATEANNLALKGVLLAAGPDTHLITTAAEHRAVLDPAKRLARGGTSVTILPVDEFGMVSAEQIAEHIRPTTTLVSVIAANNEVGSVNPIDEIAKTCRDRNVRCHTDAVQAAAYSVIDVRQTPVDLLSLSAHKIYGPKGAGALFVRRDGGRIPIEPLIDGGGHERRLRSGTLPVPLIVGFGAACELIRDRRDEETVRLKSLRDTLWAGLCERLDGLYLNGHPEQRLPHNLNVSFDDVDGEALMMSLKRIAVSSGSACTSADPEPSHVLRAMGRNDQLTRASLRFGLGRMTSASHINIAVDEVSQAVARLRG